MAEKEEKKLLRRSVGILPDENTPTRKTPGTEGTATATRSAAKSAQQGQTSPAERINVSDFLTRTQAFRIGTARNPFQTEQRAPDERAAPFDFLTRTQAFRVNAPGNRPQAQTLIAEEAGDAAEQPFHPLTGGIGGGEDLFALTRSFRTSPVRPVAKVDWEVGDVIDSKYEVREIIGRGGMGIVYKVHHREWELDLAVKMPLPQAIANETAKIRFIREAQTWVDLGLHPNVVQCWYVRELGGVPCVFMDYLDGGSLKDWIYDGKVRPGAWAQILDLIIQACDGLGYAHEHGVEVHRDVKPGNLLLTKGGELRVADFGLAKQQGRSDVAAAEVTVAVGAAQHAMTLTGSALGTPEYGAPEQWGEAKHAELRADIYALGGVLFELCCGRRAFDDRRTDEQAHVLIGRHLFSPAPDPREFNKDIPPELAELILQCLAKNPAARPASMLELRQKLVAIYVNKLGTPYSREIPELAELRSDALNNLAVSLLDLGRKEEALAAFAAALKFDAQHAETIYNQALLEWRAETIADAEVVRRLQEAKQASLRAGLYLGFIHMERAAADEAEQELTAALQDARLSKDNLAWRMLGDACMAQEKYAAATAAYQKALDLIPRDAIALERKLLAQMQTRQQAGRVLFPWPRCLRTVKGYNEKLNTMALTSDGRFAILGNPSGIKLWDLVTGKYLWTFSWSKDKGMWTFKGHANSVTAVTITADRKFVVSGGSTETYVRLWDFATGKCLRNLAGHQGGVTAVALTPNGQAVLSGSTDKTLRLWDVAAGTCLRTLAGHQSGVTAAAVTPDGQAAISGGQDKTLRLWDLATGRGLRTFKGHKDELSALAVTPDGRMVVSGSRDRTLRVWNLSTGRCLRVLEGHRQGVTAVAITPDGYFAVSGSRDETLRVWSLRTGECLRVCAGHQSSVTALAVTPDGRFVVSVSRDKTLRTWSLATGKCLRLLKGYTYWLEAIAVTSDGRFAVAGNSDEMRLNDLVTGKYLQVFQTSPETEGSVMGTPDGGREPETLRLWDLPLGECFLTLEGAGDERAAVAVTPDGRFAVSGSKDATLRLWDLLLRRCLWMFKSSEAFQVFKSDRNWMGYTAVSLDGQFVVSGWYDPSLRLWDVATGKALRTFEGHAEPVTAVAISADGQSAISGSSDQTLRLWDLLTGDCLQTFKGHADTVNAVALIPGGRFAISGSSDQTLRLWSLATGKCLRTFAGHEGSVTAVAVTPDGRLAISGSSDKTLRLWLLDPEFQSYRATLQVCRQRDHQELQLLRERFRKHLSQAELARKSGSAALAYTFLTLARSVPGYERDPEALAINVALVGILAHRNLRAGRLRQIIEGHDDSVTAVTVTTDGRFILSGSRDQTVRLWALATGKCLRTFAGHGDNVACVAVTPDRHFVVSGSWDKTLRLWAIATGECLKTFSGHKDYVKAIAVVPDGYFAVSGSGDNTLRLWSLLTDKYLQLFEGLALPLEDAYKSAELATEKTLRTFQGHRQEVETVALTPDSRFALSGSQDKTLRLWDLQSGKCLRIFEGHEGYVTAVAVVSDGRLALSGSRDKTLRLWNLKTGKCLRIFTGHHDYVTTVAVTHDRRFAVSGSWDKSIRLWNLRTGECLRTFEGHTDVVESVAITPDGRFAVSGSRDHTLRVWEFEWELTPA